MVTFADLEKVEKCSRTLIAGQSQSYCLLSAFLSQLKRDDFQLSDPSLFDKNISTLSASFATQTSICTGLTEFVEAKCRESFLAHVSRPVLEPQKCELLVSAGSNSFLFDQLLLQKISNQMKEDSLIASSLSLLKISKSSNCLQSSHSSGQRYSSPMDFSRPGPSGGRKRSVSPARGNASKRGRGGSGRSPSARSRWGFRK